MEHEGYRVTAEHEESHWWFLARRRLFLAQVRKAAGELGYPGRRLSLLDYGCGTGYNLRYLAEFGDVSGADVSDLSLGEFRKPGPYPIYDLRAGAGSRLPRFDVVTLLDVLEHMDDDAEGLRKVADLLRPEGQIVITVPAYRWLWSGEDELSRHKRRYTRGGLLDCCARAGLEVLHASYFNALILPAMAAVIWKNRIFSPGRYRESSVQPTSGWLNRLLYRIASFEAGLVGTGRVSPLAGASIVCRVRAARGSA